MNKPQNIEFVVQNGLCVSCGVCEAACPRKAIKIVFNAHEGMLLPTVNDKDCNACDICLEVCYGFKVHRKLELEMFQKYSNSFIGHYLRCYVGFANDKMLRFNSTSGGVVTSLLLYGLKKSEIDGAIVTKMQAKGFIATTPAEIVSSTGSKYCPVSLGESLAALEKDKHYAVVGLPCHIYGVRKLAQFNRKIRNSIHLYIGILCGGMPSYAATEYLLKIYNMEKQYITKFEYRGGGWPGRLLIESKSLRHSRKISIPYPEYWQDAFGYFLPYRCVVCHDGFNEFSDISCGDAWLPRLIEKDKEGTSLIITRSKIGEDIVQRAFKDHYIDITSIKARDVIQAQRGLVQFKNIDIGARLSLFKIMEKKLPAFETKIKSATTPAGYLSAIELCIGNAMASKRKLWGLFGTYCLLHRLTNMIKSIHRIKK